MVIPLQKAVLAMLVSCEVTTSSQQSASRKRVFTRPQPCWHPDLGFPAVRTVGTKFILFINENKQENTVLKIVVTGKV